jgi:hypothetical protein
MPEAKKPPPLPVILELAPLPREQIGPYLLLGVEKAATPEEVEAAWAKRLIWARKKQVKVALEDINWAKEVLGEPDRRVTADAASLNLDTVDGVLKRLEQKYENAGANSSCQPLDEEKDLAEAAPALEVPDPATVAAGIQVPDIPREFPVVRALLEQFAKEPVDPWKVDLPSENS